MKKAQSFIIQFILFFIIGFMLFITIGSFFKNQSDAFRADSIDENIKLTNSYLSSFSISLIDSCKSCDYANVQIRLENTTSGYFFEQTLSSLGLNVSVPGTAKYFTSPVHNLNSSTTFAPSKASSAKTITLTFNRTKNELRME